MQLKDGAIVYSFDDEVVGRIDRVVLHPKTEDATHIVVRKGVLLTEDKIISLDLLASVSEDRVSLCQDAGPSAELPRFEQARYIWYPSMSAWLGYPAGVGLEDLHPKRTEPERNISEEAIALNEADASH